MRNRFSDHRRYAIAEEVGLTTGFSHRRLDMMVLDCYESNGFRIDGIEIKVSTGDLRRELQDPEKHIAFFDVIDYYTLATPAKVVEPLIDVILLIKAQAKKLDFEPTCPLDLLKSQANAMGNYLYCLEVRAQMESIDL